MRIGLKLWSVNTDFYLNAAKNLYDKGVYDYIELYVVPGSLKTISKWNELKIPFNLHAPHFDSGANLAEKNKEQLNRKIYDDVKIFQQELNPEFIVVHGGIEGSVDETIRQLKEINLQNVLIENKPYLGPTDPNLRCRGSIFEEIEKITKELNCGFCLDVSHCICTANSLKIDPYEYIEKFNTLNPKCYHLCDNFIDSEIDRHKHFGKGNFDFDKIFKIINKNSSIAIETSKDSKENLDDFIDDVNFVKQRIIRG